MSRIAITIYGVVCYVLFNITFLYLGAFLLEISVSKAINSGEQTGTATAISVNLALIAAFGISHSVMARERFKRWWTQFIPEAAERSTYVLQSSLFLALAMWQWRSMPSVVWHVEGIAAWAFYAAFAIGVGIVLLTTFLIDHFELFGLKQIWTNHRARPMPEPEFRTPSLYKIVRHPMQFGVVIMFLATPHMTVGHLIFAAAMIAYIRIGLHFEERALVREFGDTYRAYQRDVPMLFPRFARPGKVAGYPTGAR